MKVVPFFQRVSMRRRSHTEVEPYTSFFYMSFPKLSLHWKEGWRYILAKGPSRGISTKDYVSSPCLCEKDVQRSSYGQIREQ